MKNLIFILIAIFAIYCFAVNPDVRSGFIDESKNISENISEISGGGKKVQEIVNDKTNDKYTEEEKEYFKQIALSSEFSNNDNGTVCKWESDINIFVTNEKPEHLMDELNKVVNELNDIINPININIVDNRSDANFFVCFGSQNDYNTLEPASVGYTEDNWGLFTVNSGSVIKSGALYVDIYRCESINGQKHLLREELTQALGLFNDSYKYRNSIFQQDWTETTEYAPIDIRMIELLYNN
jgi:hypothetical protein